MTLSLADRGEFPDRVNDWPLPPEPLFAGSAQFDKLSRDISRFVNGDVLGRSYLVAGHRGAGKTALVIRAVQDLRTSILRESVKEEPALPRQVEGLQRPLLVKLHGPSLLCVPDPVPAPKPSPAPDPAKKGQAGDGAAAQPDSTARPAPIQDRTHAALVQITIGLYRALAAEASLGYEVHARASDPTGSGELPELAAQLSLELDTGPEPALLRRYWTALSRLSKGVFWPPSADDSLAARGIREQGMREVVAITTAAQAFQVCTGHVTYDTTVKKMDVLVTETKTQAATDLKDVIGRVSTLGVGALTGVSLAGMQGIGPIAGIGAGLAVWLIGNFSLNWTITRTRTDDQKINYSFIRDRTVTTLDRDLPLVIKRIREAGLAPVFVIDELDKVKNAGASIRELVDNLKNLVTDYGFFCFLVNRDLFDEIEQRVENLVYPVDHTHFSQRLMVRAEPNRLLVYLARLLKEDVPSATGDFPRTAFALTVMHRAKFNFADLTRAVADAAGAQDKLRMSESELTSPKQLFIAAVQIAINEILRKPKLIEHMREDSAFAQLVVDTLYYPSRRWEAGEKAVPAEKSDLEVYLKGRMASDDIAEDKQRAPSGPELAQLYALFIELLNRLADFPALKRDLQERYVFDDQVLAGLPEAMVATLPKSVYLRELFPSIGNGSLMARSKAARLQYRFLYDSQGEKLAGGAPSLTAARATEAKNLLSQVKAFDAIMKRVGVDLEQLTEAKLLPPIATMADFAASRRSIETALQEGSYGPAVGAALDRFRRLAGALDERGKSLGAALLLVASVARDAGSQDATLPRIGRLIDFTVPPEQWVAAWAPPGQPIESSVAALNRWREAMGGRLLPPLPASTTQPDPYDLLSDRLPRYFDTGETNLGPFRYGELVLAARGETPYRYLRSSADIMLARDWSGLVLEAMPRGEETAQAPYWLLVAALRGLGFGQPLLGELADEALLGDLASQHWLVETPALTAGRCMEIARRLAAGAPAANPGMLLLTSDEDAVAGAQPPSRRRPTLIVGETNSMDYIGPIRWLDALGAFAALVEEGIS